MKKFLFSLMLVIGILGFVFAPVSAQTYQFSVSNTLVNVVINADGTASVEYTFDFVNDPSASMIDAVDVGMPNDSYVMSSIKADVNGQAVTDISKSPYVDPGVALNLGNLSIMPGDTGRVHVYVGKVKNMLHPGTQKEAEKYASFQFSPTWFGSEYVNGKTDMTVTLTLPAGLKAEEPRWFNPNNWPGDNAPLSGYDTQNRVFYQWRSAQADSSSQYTFGAAFPARLVPESSIVAAPVFNFKIDDDTLCCGGFFILFFGFMGLTTWASASASRKRKLQYLPPKISIEGHGIKRGLTAVEAAVLMEQPPDKIFTMILYSVVKKGAASVISKDPLKLNVTSPLPEGLRGYETEFLEAMSQEKVVGERRELQNLMIKLIQNVTEKMKGFSQKETVTYYKGINEKAWQMIKEANMPDVQMKLFDEALDWSMMSSDFDKKASEAFSGRTVYVPTWWGHYDPAYHNMGQGFGSSVSSGGGGGIQIQGSLPTLPGADFAASMVNGVQNFSANVLGDLNKFTGAVTDKTNPVPITRSSGGHSGGGCACACACAGCACACAGGGR